MAAGQAPGNAQGIGAIPRSSIAPSGRGPQRGPHAARPTARPTCGAARRPSRPASRIPPCGAMVTRQPWIRLTGGHARCDRLVCIVAAARPLGQASPPPRIPPCGAVAASRPWPLLRTGGGAPSRQAPGLGCLARPCEQPPEPPPVDSDAPAPRLRKEGPDGPFRPVGAPCPVDPASRPGHSGRSIRSTRKACARRPGHPSRAPLETEAGRGGGT